MATPIIVGAAIAGIAYTGRFVLRSIQRARSNQSIFDSAIPSFTIESVEEGFEAKMTKEEAANILGIKVDSSKDEVKLRHKHLIIKNHPDKGGSSYLATKINEARNTLSTK